MVVLLCGVAVPAWGQAPATVSMLVPQPKPNSAFELRTQLTQSLSLQEALDQAIRRNPTLYTSRVQVEQAEAALALVRTRLQPSVSTIFGVTTSLLNRDETGNQQISNSFSLSTSVPSLAIRTNWTLYSSGLVQGQLVAAAANLHYFDLEVQRQIQQVKLDVVRSYIALQKAQSQIQIAELALQTTEATLEDTRHLVAAGQLTRFEQVRAEVQVLTARQNLLTARSARQVSQRDLARLLNYATPTEVSARDPVAENGTWEYGLEETIFRAIANRVELGQAESREQQALALKSSALAQLGPQIQLTSSVGYDNQYSLGRASRTIADTVLMSTTDLGARVFSTTVAVQVSMPLSDGGVAVAEARTAEAQANLARLDYIRQANTLRFEVEQSFEYLRAAREQIALGRDQVRQATQALEFARVRFRAGVATHLEVIAAENDLTRTRGQLLDAILNYNQSYANLRQSIGVL
jgi:OMF family outer membrane factor